MSRPSFNNPDFDIDGQFRDVFGIDEFKETREQREALISAIWDGPTDAEIDRSLARMDHVLGPGWQDEVERTIQEKLMGPDHSRHGVFVYHRCWKCDDGARPCINGSPNLCDFPRVRNE